MSHISRITDCTNLYERVCFKVWIHGYHEQMFRATNRGISCGIACMKQRFQVCFPVPFAKYAHAKSHCFQKSIMVHFWYGFMIHLYFLLSRMLVYNIISCCFDVIALYSARNRYCLNSDVNGNKHAHLVRKRCCLRLQPFRLNSHHGHSLHGRKICNNYMYHTKTRLSNVFHIIIIFYLYKECQEYRSFTCKIDDNIICIILWLCSTAVYMFTHFFTGLTLVD